MHQKIKEQVNVKIIKLINGEDIVCHLPQKDKQLPDDSALLRLHRPLQVKYVPQITPGGFKDYIALIRWVNFTPDNIITIPKDKIMTIAGASKEMVKSYSLIEKDYHTLKTPDKDQSVYKQKKFTDEESKRIREIFEDIEYDEDDEGNKTIH
tara:strand:+ start:2622 stop:3077 length:456 start_codon:yes stop_codon:yes gene_type:complete